MNLQEVKRFQKIAGLLNESNLEEAKNIKVITRGGKEHIFTNNDIQELLDSEDILSPDNLGGWIYRLGLLGNPGFPKKEEKIRFILKKMIDFNGDVIVNIGSKFPHENKIEFRS